MNRCRLRLCAIALGVFVLCAVAGLAPGHASATARALSGDAAWPERGAVAPGAVVVVVVAPNEPLGDPQRHLRIFRELWAIVNERYIYPDFNGLDWRAARSETEARINEGLTDAQFYDAMRDLMAGLNDDHSSFLSPEEAQDEEEEFAGTGSFVGIGVVTDLNPDAKRVFVLQVVPNSPAALGGIRPHDHILKADGVPLVGEDGEPRLALLRGAEGTTVTVTVRTPGGAPRDLALRRARLPSASVVETRLLQENPRIGYILIPTFFEDSIDLQVRSGLRSLMKGRNRRLDGLVIDMRINGGGAYDILSANLGFFMRGTAGYLVDRQGTRAPLTARAERIGNSQTVPLAILMGPSTQSYAEVFAGVLRDRGRARLVGQRSGGNVETLLAHRFEDGSVAWIAEETFRLPDGANWEGTGLQPDAPVDKAWDEFTAGDDPALAKAIELLTAAR